MAMERWIRTALVGSTFRRIAVEPLHQLVSVFIEEVDVGLDHFERLEQGPATGTDVDVAEESVDAFQIERVVEVGHGGHDQPADGGRGPTERRLDHTPARLQLPPDQQRSHRIAGHVLHHRPDILHSNGIVLHGEV